MALKGDLKSKWIQAIQSHQTFNDVFTYINVCSLHFNVDDILANKKLKKGAIPTIFP